MHIILYGTVAIPAAFCGGVLGYNLTSSTPGTIISIYVSVILMVGLAIGYVAQREQDKEC